MPRRSSRTSSGRSSVPEHECNPFRPGTLLPQAVGLGKTQDGIGECQLRCRPQAGVSEAVGKIEKDLRRVPVGADVQQGQQTLGNHPGILVHEQNSAQADQQNKDALGEFEGSNHPQQISLGAVQVDFRCRREHAARKQPQITTTACIVLFFSATVMESDIC